MSALDTIFTVPHTGPRGCAMLRNIGSCHLSVSRCVLFKKLSKNEAYKYHAFISACSSHPASLAIIARAIAGLMPSRHEAAVFGANHSGGLEV
jgi:hypothetical protein